MTNKEKIQNMTTEELAVFLCSGDLACKGCRYECDPEDCYKETEVYRKWLEKEVDT